MSLDKGEGLLSQGGFHKLKTSLQARIFANLPNRINLTGSNSMTKSNPTKPLIIRRCRMTAISDDNFCLAFSKKGRQ